MNSFKQADALIVVDMQNSFLHPDGGMRRHRGRQLADIDRLIQHNQQAVELASIHDVPVIYTRHCYRPGYPDAGPKVRRLFESMGVEPLVAGSWDADLVDELRDDDGLVVDKTRMDAFHQTDLEVVLRGLHASRLLVAGIVTNACVETTTRAAAMRDHEVTVLGDCCGTYSPEQQASSLAALEFFMFAQVADLEVARTTAVFAT